MLYGHLTIQYCTDCVYASVSALDRESTPREAAGKLKFLIAFDRNMLIWRELQEIQMPATDGEFKSPKLR